VIFVLPWALPGYITALIWNNLWQQNSGGFNLLFESINESLGTNFPTRTAWLTELEAPINLLPIIPYLVILVCGGLALWMGWRTIRSGGLTEELDAHKAAPVFTPADAAATAAALLLVVGFFFIPFISANGQNATAFNLLWNYSAYGDVIDRELLLLLFFVSVAAIATAIWGLLDINARPVARLILLVGGVVGGVFFAIYFVTARSYPEAVPSFGFWVSVVGVMLSLLQFTIPRPMHVNATGIVKRVSIGKSVFTVGAIVLLTLAAIGTLNDVIANGSQASNAVIDLFERAGAPKLAFFAVLLANIWLGWPFMMVVATGALQSIPPDLYEAADVDGATKWTQFRRITLPLLRPAMVPAIMLGTVWTFNQFNVIFFITAGGPRNQTDLLVTQSYKLIQQEQVYGAAAAFSIIVFFILLVITLIQNRVTQATKSYDEA
jgi:ABC-type sugar transport system permease subunit